MKIRKLFQKNFEKRSANWSPEKKAKRLKIRQGTFQALQIAKNVIDIPTGGAVSAILDVPDETIRNAVQDADHPEFTQEVADVLKSPLMVKATSMAQEFIDLIEEEMGIDIPDVLEERIVKRAVDVLADQFDELADAAEGQIVSLIDAGVDWIRDFFKD